MNPNPRKVRCLCLLLALTLLVSGCGGGEITIIPEPLETDGDIQSQAALNEANYESPGYYAPNTVMNETAPVVPAPATVQEIREAAQQAMMSADYEQASTFTTIPRGDINIGLVVADGASVNPLKSRSIDMMNLNTLVFEGLVALDEAQMPVPQLADRWTESGDTWTFALRPNILFHDGSELTAEDVVASYNELKRNKGSYWNPLVEQVINGMQTLDPYTVQVKSQCGYMTLYAMTFPIVQRASVESEIPYGTGPYVTAAYDMNNAIRLEINPNWWKRGTGQIQSVVGLYYRTPKQAVEALERGGEIDTLASEYPTASLSRNLSDRMTLDYSTLTYECIVPNLRGSILKDKRVREALMYAIDRTTLAGTVYTGMVQESEVPVVPGSWLYEPQAAQYNYNPERALQILNDAGWSDPDETGVLKGMVDGSLVELKLKLMTCDRGTTSTRSEAIAAIAEQLKLVGIELEIATFTISEVHTRLQEGRFDLALVAFELSEVPNLYFLLASTGSSNYMAYKSSEMDKRLRTAYDAQTADELEAAMSKVQLQLVDDLPILGLFFRSGVLSCKAPVSGLGSGLRRGYVLGGLPTATLN